MRIIQVVGYKNAGKTTLVCEIVRMLSERGLRVGTLKRDAHEFEPDISGTDTWKHRQSGAAATAITSASRTAWFEERPSEPERLVEGMADRGIEALVVEGFKKASYPKMVLLRGPEDADLLALSNIIAIVTRFPVPAIEPLEASESSHAAEALAFSETPASPNIFDAFQKASTQGIPVFAAPDSGYESVVAFVSRIFA